MARSITIAIGAAFWLAAFAAQAAGLGRLTVLSPLGQPLLAEVEIVSLQAGEEEGLSARLASPDAFSAAGIEISPALHGLRINIARRGNRPVLRLTTTQPVNEPFLDVLIELQWASGRLVREYTFLLDPPDYRNRQTIAAAPATSAPAPQPQARAEPAAAPQAAPAPAPQAEPAPASQAEAQPAAAALAPAPAEAPAPADEKPASSETQPADAKPAAIEQQPIPPEQAQGTKEEATKEDLGKEEPAKEEPAKEAQAKDEQAKPSTYEVKKGDTLGAIARANLQPGVTLNQMLVAIFRANQEAFIHGNVNLVRTGKILNIPSAETVGSIDTEEANQLVKEHQAQFTEYRSRLAAAPAGVQGGPEREAAGRIEAKPEATPPAAPANEVRLSKSEPGKPEAPASRAAREDDAAARERALQEAQSRTSELEKNIADLQKLLDLKNQQLAELEKKASAKPPAGAVAPQAKAAPSAPTQPAAPDKPAAAPSAPTPPASVAPAQPAPKPVPGPVAQTPQSAQPQAPQAQPQAQPATREAPKPPAEKKAAPAKAKPQAAPPPEPSLFDEFLDNPMYLALLAALVVLLLVYGAWKWRKKKAAHAKFQDSVLGAAAAGGGAAALHEPTANPVTATASVSQAPVSQAPAGMEAEEVDPIAEADVYMAYGRDAQAEEILKEALQKDSSRVAVHGKLLEIYANRKDAKAFEQTALKLKNLTIGSGPDWEKAAALGRSIDPGNGIYGSAAAAQAEPVAAPAAPAAAPMLDFDLGGASQGSPATPDISLDEPGKDSTATSVDFELGATQTLKLDQQSPDQTLAGSEASASAGGGLDFDLDLGAAEDKPAAAAAASAKPPADEPSVGGLDFNLDLDDKSEGAPPPPPQPSAPVDLGDISLDLGSPAEQTAAASPVSGDPKWQEVATKLDLAKAYEEMGDKDGARELLNEVMKDGDTAQKGQAEQLLAKLA